MSSYWDACLSVLHDVEHSIGLDAFPLYRQHKSGPTDDRPQVPFLLLYFAFTSFVYILETYLDIRQHKKLHAKTPPKALLGVLKGLDTDGEGRSDVVSKVENKFLASQSYGLEKSRFHFFDSAFDLLRTLASNLLGLSPWLWDASESIVGKWGFWDRGHIQTSLVFVTLGTIILTIVELPFALYSTFVVEARHGFNKQTLGLFFVDKIKGILLTIAISGPVLYCVLQIMELGGRYFYVYVWGFMFVFSVIILTIMPVLIMPLFNKYTLLQDGELKSGIEALAARVKFPLTKLFVVDGSKRSGHSNAYFYGFFKNKRIVLYDTLIEQADTSEIVSILGHELGHWQMSHTIQGFVITQLYFLASFSAFALATELGEDLRRSFGYSTTAPLITLYLFFAVMWAPVDHLLGVLMNMLSRRNEFQADAYAVKLGYAKGLKSGLVKLQLENLGNMNPDPWYSAFHYSHPPLVERLQAMSDAMDVKKRI